MIKAVLEWVKSLLAEKSCQDSIDYFIASKNPTSPAEVEYWIRVYDEGRKGWSL